MTALRCPVLTCSWVYQAGEDDPALVVQHLATHRTAHAPPVYDRAVLVEVLVYHYRRDIKGCGCGWSKLGASWPDHVVDVYEESVAARGQQECPGLRLWPDDPRNIDLGSRT